MYIYLLTILFHQNLEQRKEILNIILQGEKVINKKYSGNVQHVATLRCLNNLLT